MEQWVIGIRRYRLAFKEETSCGRTQRCTPEMSSSMPDRWWSKEGMWSMNAMMTEDEIKAEPSLNWWNGKIWPEAFSWLCTLWHRMSTMSTMPRTAWMMGKVCTIYVVMRDAVVSSGWGDKIGESWCTWRSGGWWARCWWWKALIARNLGWGWFKSGWKTLHLQSRCRSQTCLLLPGSLVGQGAVGRQVWIKRQLRPSKSWPEMTDL